MRKIAYLIYFFSFLGHSVKCQVKHVQRLNADLQIDLPIPRRKVCCDKDARRFYQLMAHLYVKRFFKHATLFGEKTPEHTGRIYQIRRIFPNTKFVFIYRDGRDVALSLTKVPWMHPDLFICFSIWLYYYRILLRVRNDPTLNLIFVKYEDLVANPACELRKITTFLGIPYENALAEGYGNREGVPEREYPWKSRAFETISTARVAVWQKELSLPQVGYLERLGGRALTSLGYDLVTEGTTRLPLLFFPKLGWNYFRLFTRLPLHLVTSELFGRAICFS